MLRRRVMMTRAQGGVQLPAGYTQLEYIETDGNSYIDTFYNANQNTRVVMKVSGFPNTSNASLFGARTSYGSSDMFGFIASGSSVYRTSFYNKNINIAASISYSGEMVVDQNKNITYLNGSAVATATSGTFSCPYTLHLFSFNDGGAPSGYCKVKFYYCQIYDNDVKVRDYVPCTNPIGVKGLWDKVNEEFYALTPTGYTRLAYLESDGSDYIDTLYKPNSNTRVRFEGYNNSTSSGWIFGAWNAQNTAMFCASVLKDHNVMYGTKIWANATMPVGPISIDINKNAYTYNGVSGTLSEQTFSCDYAMYLFHINAAGSVSTGCFNGRIYSVKIYDNGVLVRDFIPCTNPDGISGLWDSVNDVFYKLLPADYTRLDFIETDGTTYIDTGFIPNANTRVVADMLLVRNNTEQAANEFFGARTSASALAYALQYNNSRGNMQLFYWNGYSELADSFPSSRVVYDLNKNVLSYDGKSISRTYGDWITHYPMYIFALNNAGTPTFMSIARLYSFRIYDNGTLVRDFIPAMNASGDAGLYDLKNDVWYALLPVAKPKVENKISTWNNVISEDEDFIYYQESGLQSEYPVASDITITANVLYASQGSIVNGGPRQFTIPKGANNTGAVLSGGYLEEISGSFHPLSPITSISPTEDDTYIYTF